MMTVLDTSCLPPAERTTAWAETTAQALVTTRFRFPDPGNFGARIRAMALGPVQLSVISYARLVCYRSPRLIRESDPELYQIAVVTSGRQGIEQARHHTVLGPGEIVLYDSSRPFEASARGPGSCASLVLQFPRRLMPLPDHVVAPLCGTSLGAADGVGHVFRQTLAGLAEAEPDLSGPDRQRLGTTVVDLAAAVIARRADRASALPAESRTATLYQQITAFISRHLHDAGLGPGAVAAAHSISIRYLHRVFQVHGTTVNGYIRRERIARCRRDLADPLLGAVPVGAIGARWGFPRASDFTRAFRTATGMTPTEYRSLGEPAEEETRP
ncbi:helix-turn-helix domain-containing protein [Streptomyces sp. NRRL B-3648]|uniref:AraC-like ligand-binding domain-containing protein n=1 Tax=Streptomyces sp. NRRL B-3648 TaxID=1519493 RepID=UPI0006BFD771|nr:helix-turn-helix domain-containing protein [Streptomyces sp. NRRL B-3648]KOV96110.1 AraC family transcriptional regulator [Streptomyces sp. NRRL B-3648]